MSFSSIGNYCSCRSIDRRRIIIIFIIARLPISPILSLSWCSYEFVFLMNLLAQTASSNYLAPTLSKMEMVRCFMWILSISSLSLIILFCCFDRKLHKQDHQRVAEGGRRITNIDADHSTRWFKRKFGQAIEKLKTMKQELQIKWNEAGHAGYHRWIGEKLQGVLAEDGEDRRGDCTLAGSVD